MTDERGDEGFSMMELLVVLMILGLVAWLATGQGGPPSTEGLAPDVAEKRFTDARLAAARLGTPQVLKYGDGLDAATPEGVQTRIVVFPDGTFSRIPGVGEVATLTDPPGLSRRVFHPLEIR